LLSKRNLEDEICVEDSGDGFVNFYTKSGDDLRFLFSTDDCRDLEDPDSFEEEEEE